VKKSDSSSTKDAAKTAETSKVNAQLFQSKKDNYYTSKAALVKRVAELERYIKD